MFSAFLFLQWHILRNAVLFRLRRLRQPKYLVGAIVGGGYLGMMLFGQFLRGSRGRMPVEGITRADPAVWEAAAALLLMIMLLAAWLFPKGRATLAFTEPEIAFLFPGPVSRRTLIRYKLVRLQLNLWFTALMFAVLGRMFGRASGEWWIHLCGWWLVLAVLSLHGIAASFTTARWFEAGVSNWRRRAVVVMITGALLATLGWVTYRQLAAVDFDIDSPRMLREQFLQITSTAPIASLLAPFRWIVRPYFASGLGEFLAAAAPVVLVIVAHAWWVIRTEVAFEESSLEYSQRAAARLAVMRQRRSGVVTAPTRGRRAPWRLAPTGFPAMAILWKNLLASGQLLSARIFLVLIPVVSMVVAFSLSGPRKTISTILGGLAAMIVGYAFLLGPQLLPFDFRHDLTHGDQIKSWPIVPWQLALGELMAPAVLLTGLQWGLVLLGGGCFLAALERGRELVVPVGTMVFVMAPSWNLLALLVPNAAALLFPAWFRPQAPGTAPGIEMMGQQLLRFFGQFLVLLVALIPAGVAFGVVFGVLRAVGMPLPFILPLGGVAAGGMLALEAAAGIWGLGRLFDRLDLSEE